MKRRWATAIALVAVAGSSACGGSGNAERSSEAAVDESKPHLQNDGPLHAPLLVGVRPNGRLRQPALRFTTSDTEANAFVSLGEGVAEDTTLVVAWYRLKPSGREHLFSHEIKVKAHGQARSQALARSGLPRGLYESVATLGNRQARTTWAVREGGSSARSASRAARTLQATGTDVEAGVSGFEDSSSGSPSEDSPTSGPCRLEVGRIEAEVELGVTIVWGGQCATVAIGAAVTGPPQTIRSFSAPEAVNAIGTPQTVQKATGDVCEIPGGSDLPGTVVRGFATDSGGTSASAQDVLEDNGRALIAILLSEPATGSSVQAGDRIELGARALSYPPALGIKSLSLEAAGETVATGGNASGSSEPVPCDRGRLLAELATEYVVPEDPPPVIKICAEALGFDATTNNDCALFLTRDQELWEGTIVSTVTSVPATGGPCGDQTVVEGTVRLIVDRDGTVAGTYDVDGCGVSVPHGEFKGSATDDGFAFPDLIVQTNGERVSKVSPTAARATLRNFQGSGGVGAQWSTSWMLDCKTC